MAVHIYRYRATGPSMGELGREVPGTPALSGSSNSYMDISLDSANLADLTDAMAARGWVYDSTDPTTTPAQAVASSDSNKRLLEKFISAPAAGWPSGVFEEVTYVSSFPSVVTWWTSSAKTTKIADATYTRNGAQQATTVVWRMFAADGTTVLETATDTLAYSNGTMTTRTRVISP